MALYVVYSRHPDGRYGRRLRDVNTLLDVFQSFQIEPSDFVPLAGERAPLSDPAAYSRKFIIQRLRDLYLQLPTLRYPEEVCQELGLPLRGAFSKDSATYAVVTPGTLIRDHITGREKPAPQIPHEVWNPRPVDPDVTMDAVRSMCGDVQKGR